MLGILSVLAPHGVHAYSNDVSENGVRVIKDAYYQGRSVEYGQVVIAFSESPGGDNKQTKQACEDFVVYSGNTKLTFDQIDRKSVV